MKYGSLFSGIGGFDLALNRAGFDGAWMCEIDKSCQNVLRDHFEGVRIYDDVRSIGKGNAERVDVIVGGFPCQDLSVAGKRAGLTGKRSGLWFEFARVIDELEPRWVVIENVPGLLSSNRGQDFAVILRWLVERGYGVCWRILDAQYFGVPQRRRRVFIVGSLGSGRSAEVLFERESCIGDTAPSREKGEGSPTSTLRGFGHGWQGQRNDTNAVMVQSTDGALQARDCHGIGTTIDDKAVVVAFSAGNSEKSYGIGAEENVTPPIKSGSSGTNQVPTICWEPRSQDGVPRFHNSITPPLNTAQGGQRQPMVGVRRLTPTECERLQGFPDNWTDGQSDSTRYRQLGNAVAVPVVEWIVRRIWETHENPT